MLRVIRFVALLTGMALGCTAAAQAPVIWYLDEVYSSADGSVQFAIYLAYDSGLQYLAGHTLVTTARYSSETHTFIFPNDLPGDSANRSFLVATQAFADLHVLEPDYVVPNGFFPVPIPGAFISLAGNCCYDYYDLPVDGVHALLDPDAGIGGTLWRIDNAVATNFAGQQYEFTVPPPPGPPPPPPPPPPLEWALDEVYSNADGSIQFVVHSTTQSGQQFLSGYTLVATPPPAKLRQSHTRTPGTPSTFVFPNDLPGNSANRSFLVATQGFADLHILEPDYVVPNGFFPLRGGTISVAGDGGYQYPAPPTDGVSALWQEPEVLPFFIDVAVATNFAGDEYAFPPPPPPPPPPRCHRKKDCEGHN